MDQTFGRRSQHDGAPGIMKNRLIGALRDMWYLLVVFSVATLFVGWMIGIGFGITVALVLYGTFAYFAWVRYDDDGNERPDMS
jgi:hypothetical protein